jgi:hypothetical protein
LTDEPLQKSIPRTTRGWDIYAVNMPNDSVHVPQNNTIPQAPIAGPSTGWTPPTDSGRGTTSRPNTAQIGATGSANFNSTVPKVFGSPMDSREYPKVGFQPATPGPGTAKHDKYPFSPPSLGNSTTETPGFGGLSNSGTGITTQPDVKLGSRESGSNLQPQESYHPQVSTGPVGQKRRFFK